MRPKLVFHRPDIESPDQFGAALEHLNAGNLEAGYRCLVELHERYPDDPRASNFLGMFLYNAGRNEEACMYFAKAAALARSVSAYSFNEGAALLMIDRPKDAAAAFHRSLHGDSVLPAAHCWTWTAFGQIGKLRVALSRMREALDADPAQHECTLLPNRADIDSTTLCAIDCLSPRLAVRSLRRSMARCRFGSVKLLTSSSERHEGIEIVPIDPIRSIEDYSRFVRTSLAQYVTTPFALVTQWDGYVIDGSAWSDDFLAYDYIGARWPRDMLEEKDVASNYDVGNGGFSLRSAKFLRAGADPKLVENHPEDTHMCRTYRAYLEEAHGIRFADATVADRFAFEIEEPRGTPFGFHGCFNLCCFEPDPKWTRFDFLGPEAFQ